MKNTPMIVVCFLLASLTSNIAGAQTLTSARELYAAGNWDTAKEAYEDLFAKGDPQVQVESALEISGILWEQGQYQKALKWVQKTKPLIIKAKRNDLISRRLFTLGNLYASTGRFGKGHTTLKKCEQEAHNYKDRTFEILCRISARFVRQIQGKKTSSRKQYQSDLRKLKATGNPILVGTSLAKTAALRDQVGRYGDAIQLLKLAQAQFAIAKSDPAQARNRLRLAAVYQNSGQWELANKQLQGLVSTFRNMNNRPALITAYALKGRQAQHTGNATKAISYLAKARANAAGLSSPQIRAQVQLGMCEHYSKIQHLKKSSEHCESSSKSFSKIGLWALAARAKIMFAGVAQTRKELLVAERAYIEALTLLKKVDSHSFIQRDIAFQKTNLCQVSWELKRVQAKTKCNEAKQAFGGIKKDDGVYTAMAKTHYILANLSSGKAQITEFENASRLFAKGNKKVRSADARLRASEKMKAKKAIPQIRKLLKNIEGQSDRIAVDVRISGLTHLAEDLLELRKWNEAIEVLAELKKASIKKKDWIALSWSANAKAQALLKTRRRKEAIEALEECVQASKKADDETQEKLCEENRLKLIPKEF